MRSGLCTSDRAIIKWNTNIPSFSLLLEEKCVRWMQTAHILYTIYEEIVYKDISKRHSYSYKYI